MTKTQATSNGYIVRSAVNPALVLCTDGEFYAESVHTGPGTGHEVRVYKRRSAAAKVRGGVGITVEPA